MAERCHTCKYMRLKNVYTTYGNSEIKVSAECARFPPQKYATTKTTPRDVYNRLGHASDPVSSTVHSGQPGTCPGGWCGEYSPASQEAVDSRVARMARRWAEEQSRRGNRFDDDD